MDLGHQNPMKLVLTFGPNTKGEIPIKVDAYTYVQGRWVLNGYHFSKLTHFLEDVETHN